MSHDTHARPAHAKINLGLEILHKRPDGYHEISTVFCPITLADTITFERTIEGIELSVDGLKSPPDGSNLCIRAAEHLLPIATGPVGVRIKLTKNIPVGAGLGGGSSDAACVLRTLNELWELQQEPESLANIAIELGADIPYFLTGGLTLASGIGEKLSPAQVDFPYWIVVVIPPDHVSTAWAYSQIRPRDTDTSDLSERFAQAVNDLNDLDELLTNDFEDVVLPAHPIIQRTKEILSSAGLSCVRMSGSGSAVFGLSSSEKTAREAASLFSSPFLTSLTPPIVP